MNFFARSLLLGLIGVASLSGFGQAPAAQPTGQVQPVASTAKVEMPSDPVVLLELAAKENGLQNAGTEPLHIKATYELLDDKGEVKETGTFEGLYASSTKSKFGFRSPSFNQTEYSTEAGTFRVGDQRSPDAALALARDSFFPTFPSASELGKSKLRFVDRPVGNAQLKCVTLESPKSAPPAPYFSVYCFDPVAPTLRIAETHHGADQASYNDISLIRGAYLGRRIEISELGRLQVRIRLVALEAIAQVDGDAFVPPPNAVKLEPLTRPTAPKVIRSVWPKYAVIGAAAPRSPEAGPPPRGKMVLELTVGKNGRVVDVVAPVGPPGVVQTAVDAARQWLFQPSTLDGQPVEIQMNIEMPTPD